MNQSAASLIAADQAEMNGALVMVFCLIVLVTAWLVRDAWAAFRAGTPFLEAIDDTLADWSGNTWNREELADQVTIDEMGIGRPVLIDAEKNGWV
jgi:hypothetical protein